MLSAIKSLAFIAILGLGTASAQLDKFTATKAGSIWIGDTSLYIGASFTRSSFEPVKVWLIGNEAGWTGNLYFIDPTTKQEIFLFTNKSTPNQIITLSDRYNIPIGDTVYFVYRVTTPTTANGFPNDDSHLPKYTGPNIPGVSQFVSTPSSAKYGHRWSVAGRVNDSLVRFGFEDNVNPANSDYDYDDIIFGTTLSLGFEEVKASLTFTDKDGNPFAPGAFYSPANDAVYISYSDDFAKGDINKEIVITVRNRKGAAAPDSESVFSLPLTRNGATGIWQVKIPLKEFPGGVPGDHILETYFLGEVTAKVKSHNRLGLPDGNVLSTTLNVAYPDKPEGVKIENCSEPGADITRLTTCIQVQVTDQNPTALPSDTVYAEVRCDASGDVIARVALIEQPDGTFLSRTIAKNEGAADPADAAISCQTKDNIHVTYVDEIYGGHVTADASFDGAVPQDFYFANVGDPATKITSIKDGDAPAFLAVIKTTSPNVGVVDQFIVNLATAQGETEAFTAVETGPNTNIFTVQVPFGFATVAPIPNDHKITAFLNPAQATVSVVVTGSAPVGTRIFTASITLLPALNLVRNAYIKDENGDGTGDHVYLIFTRPVEALPTSLSPTYWNQIAPAFANAKPPKLSILPGSPNVVVADFSDAPFPKGLTSIPAGAAPVATLPSDNVFGGQKPAIADSMGPILDSARIKPANNLALTPGSVGLGVDTLTVFVSEPLKSQSDWQELIRFSKRVNGACTDYSHSAPVVPEGQIEESPDHKSFTIMVASGKDATPLAGDCVFLDVSGIYTDLVSNVPPIHGEPIRGDKPLRQIEIFRGYPPVVGVSPNNPGFVLVNNDPKNDAGSTYSTNVGGQYQTTWIAPADYVNGKAYVGVTPIGGIASTSVGTDIKGPETMPDTISTVQVISTAEYIANITIFDNLGNFVKAFKQSFGYLGELSNQNRAASHGLASYLVWDLRDHNGQLAGQGVYVWKVVFLFKNNTQEIRYTRTGVTRNLSMMYGKK